MLFGDRTPWTGQQLLDLLPPDDPTNPRGADVDATPLTRTDAPIVLNATDADRAIIVRRYRLQSYQPDEFINFKAIADMARRGDFDPRLYQYGGLWIYPLAGALKAASIVGFVDLRSDMSFYLEHPDAFGRFYVVARAMSVMWGLVGVTAVYCIARRFTGDAVLAMLSGMAFAALPIVVNAAHEAKPHLAGTALMLLSILPATRYVQLGRSRDAVLAGLCCGAAFAMVVSAVLGFALLPAMVLLRRTDPIKRRTIALTLSTLAGALLYAITNPWFIYNTLFRPELTTSNIGNSTAMYAITLGGWRPAIRMLLSATGPALLLLVGASAMLIYRAIRRQRTGPCDATCRGDGTPGHLLLVPALVVLLQFVLLAEGKPIEYARFALLPLAAVVIAGIGGVRALFRREQTQRIAGGLLVLSIMLAGVVQTFYFIAGPLFPFSPVRHPTGIALYWEPAPWSCPPIDLFETQIVLLPRDRSIPAPPEFVTIIPANLASQINPQDEQFERFNWSWARFIAPEDSSTHVPQSTLPD